jgi:ABC-type transport system substrate-binding protein
LREFTTSLTVRNVHRRQHRVRVSVIPFASITPAMNESFQISNEGAWIPAYPDPSSYVPSFFSCGGANSNDYYCNPAIDHEMQHAETARPHEPARSKRPLGDG